MSMCECVCGTLMMCQAHPQRDSRRILSASFIRPIGFIYDRLSVVSTRSLSVHSQRKIAIAKHDAILFGIIISPHTITITIIRCVGWRLYARVSPYNIHNTLIGICGQFLLKLRKRFEVMIITMSKKTMICDKFHKFVFNYNFKLQRLKIKLKNYIIQNYQLNIPINTICSPDYNKFIVHINM